MTDLSIAKNILPPAKDCLTHAIAMDGYIKYLENPTPNTELQCLLCSGKEHYTPFIDPKIDDKRMWLCANPLCLTYSVKLQLGATMTQPISLRAILWPLWCENNGVGDVYANVTFESIEKSPKKEFLRKFVAKPQGIVLMQGGAGVGKTYACLGTCEMFTRTNISAIFMTQKAMSNRWLETFKAEKIDNFIDKISKISLLVIDDFGTGEIPPGFMSFFMDLINTRMQWSNRGTIVTTNLTNTKFASFCGEALTDRFNTGQKLVYTGESKRKPDII